MSQRIHLTGATGFLGRALTPLLVERGHHVTALVRSVDAAARVEAMGAAPIPGDLDSPRSVHTAFDAAAPATLVNLASLGFGHAPTIVGAAEAAGLRRALFISTTAIFTRLEPSSKQVRIAAEDTIRASTLDWTILRPTMIYGTPDDRNMWRLLRHLRRLPVVPLPGGGTNLQQPVHVDDLAAAIVAAIDTDAAIGRAYDIAGPEALSFRDVVRAAGDAVGRRPLTISLPARPVITVLSSVERTGRTLPLTAEQIERLVEDKAFDISAATADLGYRPRSFHDGIGAEATMGPTTPGRTTTGGTTAGRYARTIAHLRPEQLVHRVRLRTQQAALRRWPEPFQRRWQRPAGATSWPPGFTAIDATDPPDCGAVDDIADGTFTFLNQPRHLGHPIDWEPSDASQLWRYHLHYLEWAWTLLAHPDRDHAQRIFADHLHSWLDANPFGQWNAWAPYPTSIRAWALVNVEADLVRGTAEERRVADLLGLHAGFVANNLELDVGGNHLIKNLKALLGLGIRLGEPTMTHRAIRHLRQQLEVQVLGDGGHFERSPSYHAQVLGDLVDIEHLVTAAGIEPPEGLGQSIQRMRRWLATILMPDGDVPLLNDCERVGRSRIAALEPGEPPSSPVTALADSGYVVARPGDRIHLVADVGPPCPPDLPAHAHADFGTFELAVDGRRLVVDPGTSVYGSGPQRQWERSTRSHNTVTVDDTDQTEVWGAFRAGRLADATLEPPETDTDAAITFGGSHTGYQHLPGSPVHRRTWHITPERIEITDHLGGTGRHQVAARLLLVADQVVGSTGNEVECLGCRITIDGPPGTHPGAVSIGESQHAIRHGELAEAVALGTTWDVELPTRLVTVIQLTAAPDDTPLVASP